MKLTSNWSRGRLFWRTFTKDDTVYIIGHREGFLSNGASINYDHPTGMFQMEVKRGDIFGPTLIAAGRVFNNDDEFIIDDNGQLISAEDIANVSMDPGFKFEFYGAVTHFLSAGSADSTIKIISSLSQTTTESNTRETTVNSSATSETGAQVGAEASAGGKINEMQLGIKVNGNISTKILNKIEQVLRSILNVQMATQTLYSEEQNITLKANKLTAITSSWQRRFVTGSVTIGHDFFQYDATLGYITSRQISEYASPDDLPAELMSEYRRQNPGYIPPSTTAIIHLRANSGHYVCAEGGGGGVMVANRDLAMEWETFHLLDQGTSLNSGDIIALIAPNGQYVCAEGGGGGELVANRNGLGAWETFTILNADTSAGRISNGNQVALRANNGQFVCAEGGGGQQIIANRDAIGPWETFTIEML